MTMYHVMRFESEAVAAKALARFRDMRDGKGCWNESLIFAGQRLVTSRAVMQGEAIVEAEKQLPGYYVTVALAAIDSSLAGMSGDACRLIIDGATGDWKYRAKDLEISDTSGAVLEPVPAGMRQNNRGGK